MEFNELIAERYSARKFKNEHLPQEIIDKILAAGHKAPTGCNFQPQRILVLNTYPADDSQPIDMHYKYRNIDEVVFYDSF